MSQVTLFQKGLLFKTKRTLVINDQFYADMDKVWDLHSEFRKKGLMPNPDYFKSRLPEHLFDVVPFRDTTFVDDTFQKAMFNWMTGIKESILQLLPYIINYRPSAYPTYNDKYYRSFSIFKDASGKAYYLISTHEYAGYAGLVDFAYYDGAVLKRYGSSGLYADTPVAIGIRIPNSRQTPEGLYNDPEIPQKAYRTVLDFLSDNGINLSKHRYYASFIDDTIYKLEIVIPYRDPKTI